MYEPTNDGMMMLFCCDEIVVHVGMPSRFTIGRGGHLIGLSLYGRLEDDDDDDDDDRDRREKFADDNLLPNALVDALDDQWLSDDTSKWIL